MSVSLVRLRARLATFTKSSRGAAAVELAMVLPILTIPMVNIVDLGTYAYTRMQVQNAALTGADQVRSVCAAQGAFTPPATHTGSGYCALTAAMVTKYIQNTSLGTSVTLAASTPVVEAYYCTLTTGALQQVGTSGTPGTPPSANSPCSAYTAPSGKAWSDPTAAPGDFIQIKVTYTFTPIFAGVSVTSLLPSPITQTGLARLW